MLRVAKAIFRKVEILLFKGLRFDSPNYDYTVPKRKNKKALHLAMIDSYFNEQPGAIRVFVTTVYLFMKRAIKFTLRKLIGVVRT